MIYSAGPTGTFFTLDPGSYLDDKTVEYTVSELQKTGAKVETKETHTGAPFFQVTASQSQAAAVHATAQRLGYKP